MLIYWEHGNYLLIKNLFLIKINFQLEDIMFLIIIILNKQILIFYNKFYT